MKYSDLREGLVVVHQKENLKFFLIDDYNESITKGRYSSKEEFYCHEIPTKDFLKNFKDLKIGEISYQIWDKGVESILTHEELMRELIQAVKDANIHPTDSTEYSKCPFCNVSQHGYVDMADIEHQESCIFQKCKAYLFLHTNMELVDIKENSFIVKHENNIPIKNMEIKNEFWDDE
jgi:hypothetical protein